MSTSQRRGLGTATLSAVDIHDYFPVANPDANIGFHNSVYFFDSNPDKTVQIGGQIGPGLTPTAIYLVVVPTATGNIRWSGNYDFGLQGTEAYNNSTGALAATTTAVTINILTQIALPIAGLAVLDTLSIEFTGDLDNVLNTVSYHVLGVCVV